MYNVMVEWENGEITSEPLQLIAADDPVTCAIYGKDNGLLDLPGWKKFKSIAKRQKKFTRMVNQAKLKSYTRSPKYKYGFEVPRNYVHAMNLDEKTKNSMWKDASDLKKKQIFEYKTFVDHGHHTKSSPPTSHKKILESQGITIYQSLIGALQWALSIGRFDIHTAVMTLSGFRVAPRRGHLDRAKRVYAYLSKMKHATIRMRTEEPDYSDIPNFDYDWSQTIYGDVKECKPHDAPKPSGKHVTRSEERRVGKEC